MSPSIRRLLGTVLYFVAICAAVWAGRHVDRFAVGLAIAIALALSGALLILDAVRTRVVLGVVAGIVMLAFIVAGTDQIVDGLLPVLDDTARPPRYTLVASMVLMCFGALLGGWTACTASGEPGSVPAQVIAIIAVVVAIGFVVVLWTRTPHYIGVPFVFLLPLSARIGAAARELTSAVAVPDVEEDRRR